MCSATTTAMPAAKKTKPLPTIPPYDTTRAIEINELTFSYDPNLAPTLNKLDLQLPKGSRCLLIGANGRYVRKIFIHFASAPR